MKKCILFDVDGVLIDSMPIWANSANQYLLEKHGITAPSWVDENCTSLSLLEAGEYLLKLYPQIALPPEVIAQQVAAFIRERYIQVEAKPGMKATVQELQKQGYHLFLATASEEENVEGALRNLGVWQCFDAIYTCTAIGYSKSYIQYYERVAERVGVPCNQLIMVEDSLHSVRTAKKAGLQVLGVYEEASAAHRQEMEALCDGYFEELPQLLDWLKR